MTRTTPEQASPFSNFSSGGRLTHGIGFNVHQAHTHGGSAVESGFESGAHRPRSRDLRPPRPKVIHAVAVFRTGARGSRLQRWRQRGPGPLVGENFSTGYSTVVDK
ncbi:hypothetical protein AVEN_56421-1 [Araneus ventricosus]|uniref:Uncharacterized protein n=1 Tax=Araneus ventricosus TaxID=182803 RepID=A0A4Y2JUT5_ARAVE|nr:hypothetical protein AVEN_56421-1 [Araneus ventricosus]